MDEPGAELRASIGTDTDELRRGMQEADRIIRNSSQQLGRSAEQTGADVGAQLMRGVTAALGASLGAAGILKVSTKIVGLMDLGEQADDVRRTFVNLYGPDVQAALGGLRAAVRGQVADTELLQQTIKARGMGLAADAQEAARLFELASQTGQAYGNMGVGQSIDTFMAMAASQGTRQLAQYGVEAERVKARMDALQASVRGLSKEQAYLQAVTEEMERAAARAGEQGEPTSANLAAARQNLQESFGSAANLGLFGQAVDWVRGRTTDGANALADYFREIADGRQVLQDFRADLDQLQGTGAIGRDTYDQLRAAADRYVLGVGFGTVGTDELREALEREIAASHEAVAAGLSVAQSMDVIGDAAVQNAGKVLAFIQNMQALGAQVQGDLAAARDFAYRQASDPKKLGMAMQDLGGLRAGSPEWYAQLEEVQRVQQSITGAFERRNQAAWDYSYYTSDNAKKLGMLRDQLQGVEQGSEKYYDILTKIHQVEQDMARGGGGGSAMADWARQHEAELRSAAESVFRASSVTQEDWWRTNLGVYRDAPDEYLRRLRSAVEDPASQWQELLGGRSGDAAQLYLAEQARAWETGQWHLLGEGFDPEASREAMLQRMVEEIQARRSREALVQSLISDPRLAGMGLSPAEMTAITGTPMAAAGVDQMNALVVAAGSVDVGRELTDTIDEQFRATEETWVTMGFLSMGWMTKGQQQAAPEAARTLAEMMFPHLREMLDSAGWRP